MDYYGKHPQEQAVQELLHNMNQRTAALRHLQRELEGRNTDEGRKLANQLYAAEKLIHKTVDEYLKKWEQFPTPEA